MKPGDLIRNKHTHAVALITQKFTRERGTTNNMHRCDYEILISCDNSKLLAPCTMLEDHWEVIDEI